MMRLIFFLFISQSLFSQYLRQDCDFDNDFINHIIPFKDVTQSGFNEERKSNKIRFITKERLGKSIDSIYLNNRKEFDILVNYPAWSHLLYNYVEIFEYDVFGILMHYTTYPVSKYLSREDSVKMNHIKYEYLRVADSIYSKKYLRDELIEKWTYHKERLIYNNILEPIQVMVDDTINKNGGKTSKVIGKEWVNTKYEYLTDGRISKVFLKNNLIYLYDYTVKNKTVVTFNDYRWWEDTTWVLQEEIIRGNSNEIKKCRFTNKGYDILKVEYDVFRDKRNNVEKVTRTIVDKGLFDKPHIDASWEYEHKYDKNRLIGSTKLNYYNLFSVPKRCTYNEKLLIDRMYYPDYIVSHKYSFYD